MATAEKQSRALVTRRPLAETSRWEQQLDRAFGEFVGRSLRPFFDGYRRTPFSFGMSSPNVDLYQEKNEIVVKADLPGMEKDDIQIKFSNHQLSIKGTKKANHHVKDEDYYFSECSHGPFLRILDLPSEAQVEKAQTTLRNGVLEIRLPKIEPAKTRKIKVE